MKLDELSIEKVERKEERAWIEHQSIPKFNSRTKEEEQSKDREKAAREVEGKPRGCSILIIQKEGMIMSWMLNKTKIQKWPLDMAMWMSLWPW